MSLDVPVGTQIQCASSRDCPAGYSCSIALAQCIISGNSDDTPGLSAPQIAPSLVSATVQMRATFDATLPLAFAPTVVLGTAGHQAFTLSTSSGSHYEYTYTTDGSEGEGVWPVLASLVASSGAVSKDLTIGTVQFDFTPPAVTGASVQLTPDANNPLVRVTALRSGGSAQVSFTTSEPVVTSPAPAVNASCGSETVPLAVVSAGNTFFTYVLTGAPASDSTCTLTATLTDLAGNTLTNAALPSVSIVFDNTPPPANSLDISQVKQLRVPWGASQSGDETAMYIVPADLSPTEAPLDRAIAASFADSTLAEVRVYRTNTEAVAVGTIVPTSGGWKPQQLSLVDSPAIWVAAVDSAGNESPRTRVRNGEWVATMQGKVAGSAVENPHTFDTRDFFLGTLVQNLARQVSDAVASNDTSSETTLGTARWTDALAASPEVNDSAPIAAFDTRRGKLVLEYNLDNVTMSITEWDGVRWVRVTPTDPEGDGNPAPSSAGWTAFDERRGVTVWGDFNAFPAQLWEYDGTSWSHRCDGTPTGDVCSSNFPPNGALPAYDPDRGTLFFYGNAVWQWDGHDMTVLAASAPVDATHPTLRAGSAYGYDRVLKQTLMFGGFAASGNCEDSVSSSCPDTWGWDGSWHRLATGGPDSRMFAALAFDGTQTVLFGGQRVSGTCDGGNYCTKTWYFKDGTWSLAPLVDNLGDGVPSPRTAFNLGGDSYNGTVVLFGGANGLVHPNDTWILHDNEWQKVAPPPTDATATGRQGAAMAFDNTHGVQALTLFGGYADNCYTGSSYGEYCSDFYTLNDLAIAQVASDVFGDGIAYASSAYDPIRNNLVIYGGTDNSGDVSSMMVWDGTHFVSEPGTPGARARASMAFDGTNVVLFGGTNGGAETWVWTGSAWDQRCHGSPGDVCITSPPPRDGAAMAYDSDRHVVMMFGGYNPQTSQDMNDSWLWDGNTWTRADIGGTVHPEVGDRINMAYDASLHRMLLVGFTSSWLFDGTHWSKVTPANPEEDPLAYIGDVSAMAYDPLREQVMLAGDETWQTHLGIWHGGATQRPAHVFHVDLSATNVFATAAFKDIQVRWHAGASGHTSDTCAAVDGAALSIWSGIWQPTNATITAPASTPALLTWSLLTDPQTAALTSDAIKQHFANGAVPALDFALTPTAPNGCGPSYASVATDYAEVRVVYALP